MSSLVAWRWLVEFATTERALDASNTLGDLAADLHSHFASVDVMRPTEAALATVQAHAEREGWQPARMTVGTVAAAPWDAATFDCIALHDALVALRLTASETVAMFARLRAMLKPGGWLVVASPNPVVVGRRRTAREGLRRSDLSHQLEQAQFQEIRCLFAEPSIESARTLIPDDFAAISACENLDATQSKVFWARRGLARVGIHAALYPGYFLLARA